MYSVQVAVVLGLAAVCWAQGGGYYGGGFGGAAGGLGGYGGAEGYAVGGHGHGEDHIDYYAPPKYGYEYKVNDPHTGDFKSQHETREGDVVKGYYTLKEADGTIREVHYTADHKNGFNAEVKRTGHAVHPQHYKSGPEHY